MHSRGVGRGPEVKHSQKSPCASADGLGMAVAVGYVLVEVGCECNSCVLATESLTKGTKVRQNTGIGWVGKFWTRAVR